MFDVYRPSSLKAEARSKRGHGARTRVTSRCKVPSNRLNFLRDNDDKTYLINNYFLADKIEQMPSPNMVIVTKDDNALSNHTISLEGVSLAVTRKQTHASLYMPGMSYRRAVNLCW